MTPPSLFPRRRERPCTCLADPSEMQLPPPTGLYQIWNVTPDQYRRGRKYWELDFLADCAEKLDLLRPDVSGLGLGVGREVLMFYFARHCKEVVATDLYSSETEWSEANASSLEAIYQAAPFDYPRERLRIETSDMRKTRFPDQSFDFVWSCSSLEHVPSLTDVYQTFVEIHRVLKPGGYALLTTEYCLSEPPYLLTGMNALDKNLIELFVSQLGGLELIGPTDLSFNYLHPLCAVATRQYMFAEHESKTQQFAIPKDYVHMMGLSAIIPVGLVLKRTEDELVSWADLPIPREYRIYDSAYNLHLQEDPKTALEQLVELASLPKARINKQFHLQLIHLLLNFALQQDNSQGEENVAFLLELFCKSMPEGELQDSNLLENIATTLKHRGDLTRAAELYRKAALSPSAFADHAIRLAIQYLGAKAQMGENPLSDDLLSLMIEDLLLHGYSKIWIEGALNKANGTQELPTILKDILSASNSMVLHEFERHMA